MTAALLRWWTVPRLNSHSKPSSTGESSTAKKVIEKYWIPRRIVMLGGKFKTVFFVP